jgi:hypothetical protein
VKAPVGEDEIRAFYGWRNEYLLDDGTPRRLWEAAHMVSVPMPALLSFARRPVRTIRVNRKIEEVVKATYAEIHAAGLWFAVENTEAPTPSA